MDTFSFNFERFKELCEAFGATIKEGDQGITVRGKPVTGKDLFSDLLGAESCQFIVAQETANCTVVGYKQNGSVDPGDSKTATLAA